VIDIPEGTDSDLRSGITAAFNKNLNEALQIGVKIRWFLTNRVNPSLLMGVLKGSFGTPGLVAAVSVEKDEAGEIRLAVSSSTSLKGKPMEYLFKQAAAVAQVIRTIPKGKVFFVVSCGISLYSTANNDIGYVYTGTTEATPLCLATSAITAVNQVTSSTTSFHTFSQPLPVSGALAETYIQVKCGNAGSQGNAWLVGWLEDA